VPDKTVKQMSFILKNKGKKITVKVEFFCSLIEGLKLFLKPSAKTLGNVGNLVVFL